MQARDPHKTRIRCKLAKHRVMPCEYPFCVTKGPKDHMMRTCPVLSGKCGRCLLTGHVDTDCTRHSIKEFLMLFEAYGGANYFTRERFRHMSLGFYYISCPEAIGYLPKGINSYEDLLQLSPVEAYEITVEASMRGIKKRAERGPEYVIRMPRPRPRMFSDFADRRRKKALIDKLDMVYLFERRPDNPRILGAAGPPMLDPEATITYIDPVDVVSITGKSRKLANEQWMERTSAAGIVNEIRRICSIDQPEFVSQRTVEDTATPSVARSRAARANHPFNRCHEDADCNKCVQKTDLQRPTNRT